MLKTTRERPSAVRLALALLATALARFVEIDLGDDAERGMS
jgi:hypothetical protein